VGEEKIMTDGHPDLNATEARQGRRGKHVLWILIISLGLIVVIYGVIWLMNAGPLSDKSGNAQADPAAAATYSAPAPAAKQDNAQVAPGVTSEATESTGAAASQ
jgi:hypothetical protein